MSKEAIPFTDRIEVLTPDEPRLVRRVEIEVTDVVIDHELLIDMLAEAEAEIRDQANLYRPYPHMGRWRRSVDSLRQLHAAWKIAGVDSLLPTHYPEAFEGSPELEEEQA